MDFKCKSCGGELNLSQDGVLVCPYCGSKQYMTDSQLREHQAFRQQLLAYMSASSSEREAARSAVDLWTHSDTAMYRDSEGSDIRIEYLYDCEIDGIRMYTARKNVICVYPADKKHLALAASRNVAKLTCPSADVKDMLQYFPILVGEYDLEDGGLMVVYAKSEGMYPVAMFRPVPAVHVMWIISRLENLACILAFSDLAHHGINGDTVFINPRTHEAALLGGWHQGETARNGSQKDLSDIRATAERLLGGDKADAPKPLLRFLRSSPRDLAYDDFAAWDAVIENELGGRKFREYQL